MGALVMICIKCGLNKGGEKGYFECPDCNTFSDIIKTVFDRYVKSRQTLDTTVDLSGLGDNTSPIQTINVSNINVVKTDNVLNK